MARILVVDNYDSFVFNLVQYLQQLGASCLVRRNDAVTVGEVAGLDVDGILLSPGPGTPAQAGVIEELIAAGAGHRPILGVCLGHQAIAEVYGATVARAAELRHGRTSVVEHDGAGVLAGLPQPFAATRYHSLAVVGDTVPPELMVTARTPDGVIMGLRHRSLPVEGVQFHPESVLTQGGHRLLANWLALCGDNGAELRVAGLETDVERLRIGAD